MHVHPWLSRLLPLFLSIRSVKTIPPHRYLTRAHRRRIMENYEQDQAAIREEMDQMKGKVDAILEALQALRNERIPVVQEIPVPANQTAASQPDVIPPSTNPLEFQPRTNATLGMPFSFMTVDALGASNQGGPIPVTSGVPTMTGPACPFPAPPPHTEIPYPAFCGPQFANPEMHPIPTVERAQPVERSAEKYQILEERIRAIEGFSAYGMDAEEICLVPNIVVPPKFKTPDFQKYKGLSCPKSHIIMYCRKMASHIHNDSLLIHCFQDSLSGASLNWYMNLERNRIRSWKDLSDAFLKQYQYNIDMAPTRLQLQNQVQRTNETFKEYAQRWREMAAQVNPPLSESELVDMFMNTLQGHYYEKMVGSVSSGFSDLVRIGERIENGLKIGKIQNPANAAAGNQYGYKKPQGNFIKKKEGETSAASAQDQAPYYQVNATAPQAYVAPVGQQPWVPYQQYVQQQQGFQQQGYQQRQGQQRQNRPKRVYDRVPMTYSQLLAALLDQKLIQLAEARPPPDPLPPNYKINAKCEFHSGGSGHTTEECRVLKDKVQDLLDAKEITFTPAAPNVVNNPMPPHNGASTSGT